MTLRKTRLALALSLAAGLLAPVSAFATNGYFDYGYGTDSKGMAGAGVALPLDTMTAATNPAGMVFVGSGFDFGAAYFQPIRQYTASGGGNPAADIPHGTFQSSNSAFVIPHFGFNDMLTSDSSVGVDVYGNGGMDTKYNSLMYGGLCGPNPLGAFCSGTAGVDLSQLFVSATYAQKITPDASVGVSLIGAYQRFKAYGVGAFAGQSSDPTDLTNNGYDGSHGFGVRIGGLWKVGYGVSLGAAYQPQITMTKFSKYEGLFANQGQFNIPSNWTLGAAYQVTPYQTALLDVQRINYGQVESIANSSTSLATGSMLGTTNGPGFGWQDMTIYKFGYQLVTSRTWTWRVGYSYAKEPVSSANAEFNLLAPGVIKSHYTAGFSYHVNSANSVDVAAMFAPSQTITGANLFDPTQSVSDKMHEYEVEANWGMKF